MSIFRRYWRFVLFFAVLVGGAALLMIRFDPLPSILGGFDAAAIVFMASLIRSLGDARAGEMRRRAAENEPDHYILMLVAGLTATVVVGAVGFELAGNSGRGLAFAGATLILAWLFGNVLYALHYAHAYYLDDGSGKDAGGLNFPGKEDPRYWDFAYFAFVLGMTFQVSDVEITATGLRRTALIHSLIAFLFNLGVIALTVSLVSDALK